MGVAATDRLSPPPFSAPAAPGHYSYPEAHPPAPPPKPRPRPAPAPRPPRPERPAPPPRPSRPAEQGEAESPPRPSPPQTPRRAWGNLTAELGRFRGTVQDLERHLRAHGYPLRANQTYTSVAHHIHEYLQRRRSPAPPPGRPHPTASPDSGTWKRDSNQGIYGLSPEGVDRVAAPRHPKPEVLGTSADGALLVSLDGLRGHFERVVLRWRPQPPAEGPAGELTVPGTARTVSLPDLKPGTTYHVEVHGVRSGQTSKSYAFITTTGSVGGAARPPPPAQSHLPPEAERLPLPHCSGCHYPSDLPFCLPALPGAGSGDPHTFLCPWKPPPPTGSWWIPQAKETWSLEFSDFHLGS